MSRKATFSPKRPKENSSEHNSRKEIPNYLIENDSKFDGNYYEKLSPYESDEQFIELAKKNYNVKFIERVGQNQKMQKKQVDALLWEVAISTEEHHTKEDILALFKMLKNEKSEQNEAKRGLDLSRLKPMPENIVYVLPSKLRIKRKPKKENFDETGYHILELAGHGDEGHFVRIGEWENLSYYPARDILLKDDGNWYIKGDELNEDVSPEVFDVLVDMTEFEKVYNYHWHVKYTNFNIDTGLSAQFSKGEVSGKGRLKKVAEFLDMRYSPEEKIPIGQSVKTIKEQHHIARQNKYTQLMMKFGHEVEMKVMQAKVSKREEVLAKKTTNVREYKKQIKTLKSERNTLTSHLEEKDFLLEELKTENKNLQKLAYTTEEHWVGEDDNLIETVEVPYKTLYKRANDPEILERYKYLENKVDENASQVIRLEEKLRLKDFEYNSQDIELTQMKQKFKEEQEKNIALKGKNEQLKAKIATLPSSDTLIELETLKKDFEEKDGDYWELYFLAYDEDNPVQEFDDYGILHDRVLSYKERYEESEKKNAQIHLLQDGYLKIEDTIFGDSKDRSVEDIVEGVNTIANILTNVSKYLKIGIEKIVELFVDNVPKTEEIEKEQPSNAESVLAENNSSPGINPIKL